MPNHLSNRFINSSLRYDGLTNDTTIAGTWGGATWASMTWMCWVKLNILSADQVALISSTGANFMHMQTQGPNAFGASVLAFYHNSGQVLIVGPSIPELYGAWHHVAVTDKSGEQKCYLDGRLIGSGTATFTNITQATALRFGEGFGSGRGCPGNITDIACFKAADGTAALTQAQVQQAMQIGPSTSISSTLYGYWPHSEGTGSTLTDTITGNNGTITGALWSHNTPVDVRPSTRSLSYSIQLNGTTQSGSTAAIDLTGSNKLVIAMWAKSNGIGFGNIVFELSTDYNSLTTGFAASLQVYGASIGLKGDGGYNTFEVTNVANSKGWNRIVYVIDKSAAAASETKVYINGKLAGAKAFSGNSTNNFGNLALYFGARNNASGFTGGNFCDMRFSKDYAWTATDVLKDYTDNIRPSSDTVIAYWPCSEGSGTTLTDTSGNGRNITLLNTPTWSTDVPCKARTAA